MGVIDVLLLLTTTLIFLCVHSMVIPSHPYIAGVDLDLSNTLTTALPPPPVVASNGTALNRRKRCNRPLIIIFYSRSSTLPPFRALPSNGRLRAAPSWRGERLTQSEETLLQRCLKMYGDISQICTGLANKTAPLTDGTKNDKINNTALLRMAHKMLE